MIYFKILILLDYTSLFCWSEQRCDGVVIHFGWIYNWCSANTAGSLGLALQFHLLNDLLGQIDQYAHLVYHVHIGPLQMIYDNRALIQIILILRRQIIIIIDVRIQPNQRIHLVLLRLEKLLRVLNKKWWLHKKDGPLILNLVAKPCEPGWLALPVRHLLLDRLQVILRSGNDRCRHLPSLLRRSIGTCRGLTLVILLRPEQVRLISVAGEPAAATLICTVHGRNQIFALYRIIYASRIAFSQQVI